MQRRLWYIKNAALFSWLQEEELQRLNGTTLTLSYTPESDFYKANND